MPFDKDQPAYTAFRSIITERTSPVLAWIGAGLSLRAGLPNWTEFKGKLVTYADLKIKSLRDAEYESAKKKLEAAVKHPNNWIAFGILRSVLGNASYVAAVREALSDAAKVSVPACYSKLWHLPLNGILNLNLDKLATRAFALEYPGRALNEFTAAQVGEYFHLLNSQTPFIANLHGVVNEESSWVLAMADLRRLMADEAYKAFLDTCLMSRVVIFMGITADDVAVGGHLERLAKSGIKLNNHFWLSDRSDASTDRWAESLGIRVIRYKVQDNSHAEVDEFLEDLRTFRPEDRVELPIKPTEQLGGLDMMPLPEEIVKLSDQDIRSYLNHHAAELLKMPSDEAYRAYNTFCQKYDVAIYRSWYVNPLAPHNELMDYKIISERKKGAFAQVYLAEDKRGEYVALKLLHGYNRSNPEMLQSFRRGVRSMQIVTERKIEGVVPFIAAYEIPAFVVMEYIEGPDLKEAIDARQIREWSDVIRISNDISKTIHAAHRLPERVLHRDIRPSNIMLKGYWNDPDHWEVAVLDFDLSWHRGAAEQSVLNPQTVSGYLAPEQVNRNVGVSTRNSAVDAFGLGMTFYFIRTGKEPQFGQHQRPDWHKEVYYEIIRHPCQTWHSLPVRYARLIMNATQHEQAHRLDVSQICRELSRLRDAEANPETVESAELWVEELFAHTSLQDRYDWNSDKLEARSLLASGIEVTVRALETNRLIELQINWTSSEQQPRKQIDKWLEGAKIRAMTALREMWNLHGASIGYKTFELGADISIDALRMDVSRVAKSIDIAVHELTFK